MDVHVLLPCYGSSVLTWLWSIGVANVEEYEPAQWEIEDMSYETYLKAIDIYKRRTKRQEVKDKNNGPLKFTAFFRQKGNSLTFFSKEEEFGEGIIMRVKGGPHPVDFFFEDPYQKFKAAVEIVKGLGINVHKHKRGGYVAYIPKSARKRPTKKVAEK
jgi:hypothetical protein